MVCTKVQVGIHVGHLGKVFHVRIMAILFVDWIAANVIPNCRKFDVTVVDRRVV